MRLQAGRGDDHPDRHEGAAIRKPHRAGLAFANPRQFGAPWYSGIDDAPLLAAFTDCAEGDICIINHPYSGFVATHSPDIHIWKPVFHEGRIACFVVGHIHNTDVGGAVSASLSRTLTEIEQEGLRIPAVTLVQGGVINDFVLAVMRANVRMPDQNDGDLHMPTGGHERHPLVMVGLTYVLFTPDNRLLFNAGTLRPARAVLWRCWPNSAMPACRRPGPAISTAHPTASRPSARSTSCRASSSPPVSAAMVSASARGRAM